METTSKTSVGMPAVAESTLAGFTGKAERSKSSGRRTWARAVWLGLGFIGANIASLGIQSVQASTALYDVQFSNSGTPQTGAAVIGSAGDYWNLMNAATGSSILLDSAGTSGTVSITWSASGIYHFASDFGGGHAPLMGGYIYAHSAQGISFAGLPAGQPYTLYVYSQSDVSGRKLSVTVDGTTYTTTPSAFPTNFIAGQNYLTISGVTDAGGNISFTYDVAVGEADLNGIQLSITNDAPGITSQPGSLSVTNGGNANFTVAASGAAPLNYQWYFNSTAISGATTANYTLTGVTPTNEGNYTVIITNNYGSVTSRVAALTVLLPLPPVITSQPASQTVLAGSPVTFTITADGFRPLSYQWQFNGNAISGATATNYGLAGVTVNNAGNYTVMVSNSIGSVTSSVAALMVFLRPSIATQPTNQVVAVGGTVNLSVTATGTAPLGFQWFKNGGMVFGATNSTLTLASAGVTNSGVYYMAITNAYGLSISLPVTVTVGTPQLLAWGYNQYGQLGDGTTTIAHLPESVAGNVVAAAAGSLHSLFVKSDGTLWAMGLNCYGQLCDGTTTDRQLPESVAGNVVAAAAGAYHSLYLKSDGTLWAMGWNCYGQLGDGTTTDRHLPESVASNVVAVAAGYFHSLFLKSDGTLWAMGYNGYGQLGDGTTTGRHLPKSVASNVVAVAAGGQPSLYLKSDGTLWAMGNNDNGQLGDGTTTDRYLPESVASNVVAMAAGYFHSLVLTGDGTLWTMGQNICGQLGNGTLTSSLWPKSVASNVVAVVAGYQYSLYLKSDGALWAMGHNGSGWGDDGTTTDASSPVAVPGMSLANVISGNSADHILAVGVPLPPVITSQPASQTVLAGSPVTFTVTADGFRPLSYQWQFNGTNLAGATDASFTIASAALSDAGSYAVVVTNNYGSTVSTTATLTVTNQPPPMSTVTVAAAPTNAGSVAGSGMYFVGSNAVLTATASNNWQFINWNDGTTQNPYVITVPATNSTYTAYFAPTATITVSASPDTGGYVGGGGTFLIGSTNLITAGASNGWVFVQWSDGSTNNPYVITVPATNITYTAHFAVTATITVVASPNVGGSVTGGGTFLVGSTNLITAVASNGWAFVRWDDGATDHSHAIVAASNRTYTADFAPVATVTVVINPTNAGAWVTGGGACLVGSNAVLTAVAPTPTNGNSWRFLNWNGTVTNYTKTGNTNNPLAFTVTTNITVTANFAQVTSDGLVYTHIWVKPKLPVIKGIPIRSLNETLVEGIGIIGYVGGALSLTIPGYIDGLQVNKIYSGALTGEKFELIDFADDVSNITLDGTSIDTECLDIANIADFDEFLEAGDIVFGAGAVAIEAGAMEGGGGVLIAGGLSLGALGILADIFSNLAIVSVTSDPHSGGHTSGSGLYFRYAPVLLTAKANSGWRFNGWSDGSNTSKHWVTAPYTVTAHFVPVSTVTVVAEPEDGGTVSGGGTFDVGTQIQITATAQEYWKFMEWDDGNTNLTRIITVPAYDVTYTATFEELKLEVEVEAGPNIGGLAPGLATGSGEYGLFDTVTLTATPTIPKWKFNKWVLKVNGVPLDSHLFTNSSPATPLLVFPVTPDMLGLKLNVDADFSTDVEVTTAANPHYAGSVKGEGSCEWPPVMDNLPLVTATPADGWAFTGWDSPLTTNSPSNPFCPILDMVTPFDFTVTANFTPTRLTTYASGNSLTLDWPVGLVLQSQTNTLTGTNWFDVPGIGASNSVVIIMDPANTSVFYRLSRP
jgi:alpha-tubulin suppressor-like RCC1 family protein